MQFVTTLVSFPVVSLLTMSIAAKNTVAIAATSSARGYRSWHSKRLIFRYYYYILEFRRAL